MPPVNRGPAKQPLAVTQLSHLLCEFAIDSCKSSRYYSVESTNIKELRCAELEDSYCSPGVLPNDAGTGYVCPRLGNHVLLDFSEDGGQTKPKGQ